MSEAVTVYYLAIESADFVAVSSQPEGCEIKQSTQSVGALNAFFYRWVGADWGWTDKLELTSEQWQTHAEGCELWIIYDRGTPAGYFELATEKGVTDLQYFGLAPHAVGRGLGKFALEFAITQGLLRSPKLTVNTCTWDHPAALPNYLARGFKPLYQEVEQRE